MKTNLILRDFPPNLWTDFVIMLKGKCFFLNVKFKKEAVFVVENFYILITLLKAEKIFNQLYCIWILKRKDNKNS